MENNTAIMHYDVAVIGGGLAGLIVAIELSNGGRSVILFEKKQYPYHKVCGEYVSNEVLPYLQSMGFDPYAFGAVNVTKLCVTAASGRSLSTTLPLGGFGLSRYTMDEALAQLAIAKGTHLLTGTRVTDVVQCSSNSFQITADNGHQYTATSAIGSWGKRDVLDKKLDRAFMQGHTGFMGVKYHIRGDFPADEISLHLFAGGYCGLSRVENDEFNLCYLYRRGKLPFKSIPELEEKALYGNKGLRSILKNATQVLESPEVINEISFAPKNAVENGIMMCGDAAGLITPLCGNGMAMAIRSGRLLAHCMLSAGDLTNASNREALNNIYSQSWNAAFHSRLAWGRRLQNLFYKPALVDVSLRILKMAPPLQQWLIKKTHGSVIAAS